MEREISESDTVRVKYRPWCGSRWHVSAQIRREKIELFFDSWSDMARFANDLGHSVTSALYQDDAVLQISPWRFLAQTSRGNIELLFEDWDEAFGFANALGVQVTAWADAFRAVGRQIENEKGTVNEAVE